MLGKYVVGYQAALGRHINIEKGGSEFQMKLSDVVAARPGQPSGGFAGVG